MDISLDHDIDATNSIKFYFLVLIFAPVAHGCHVDALSLVFLVSYKQLTISKAD